jgi:hypothetical protein
MTAEDIQIAAAQLRRERVPTQLIKSFTWYRNLTEERRVEVEEMLGICCGQDPVTAEAYAQARACIP